MHQLYNFGIRCYLLAAQVAAWFKPKAKLWLDGRKYLFKNLEQFTCSTQPTAWFHCASLGEFEQGRPVIEAFKKKHPEYRILLTFFSPSGFEIRKNYSHADHVCYLPADTPANAKRFITMVNPTVVVFVKYEYWLNFIYEITIRDIHFYVLSANFRPGQFFFRWYGKWFLKSLKKITRFFVQNQESANLLIKHGVTQVTVTGDTRFDRVAAIASEEISMPVIDVFVAGCSEIIVAGSTWQADEALLVKLFSDHKGKFKLILAPHEINSTHIKAIEDQFTGNAVRYSIALHEGTVGKTVLIIDSIGMLSKLYRYGRYAYIGGGFGVGIHNILEAAVYGIPVVFGPNYHKFLEAIDLIASGGAFSISDYDGFATTIRKLSSDKNAWKRSADAAHRFVALQTGATEKAMQWL